MSHRATDQRVHPDRIWRGQGDASTLAAGAARQDGPALSSARAREPRDRPARWRDLHPARHPDVSLHVRPQEALLSSQIEGTQSSLSDLLLFESEEAPDVPLDDVQEVSNYVAAMNHGLDRIRDGFPLSLRLIREIHAILLERDAGARSSSGVPKSGSVERDQAMRSLSHHRPSASLT